MSATGPQKTAPGMSPGALTNHDCGSSTGSGLVAQSIHTDSVPRRIISGIGGFLIMRKALYGQTEPRQALAYLREQLVIAKVVKFAGRVTVCVWP